MTMKIDHRAVLITGAASGLGAEFARQLADRGARLVLWDRDEAKLKAIAKELGAHFEVVDLRDHEAIKRAVESSREAAGPLGHLILSAGILSVGEAATESIEAVRAMMEVNFLSSIALANAALPALKAGQHKKERSTILFVSSVAGIRGFPELAGYSASKFAVVGYAEALRSELRGTRIDIRVLLPSPMKTPMVDALPSIPPVYRLSKMYTAEQTVHYALEALKRPGFQILPDGNARLVAFLVRRAPRFLDRVLGLAEWLPARG